MIKEDKIKNYDFFLWRRFIEGDQKALEEIYKGHYQALYNYGLRIHADTDIVKDAIQELFYDIISSLNTLGDTDNIRFYLVAAFRRKMMLALKKKAEYILPESGYEFDFDVSVEDTMIQSEENRTIQLKIRKIINNLSSRQKEAIFLKFYNNMSYEQITQIMGINYQSARSIIYKAIHVMREIFEQEKYAEKAKMY